MSILGIDIGTTSTKVMVLSNEGNILKISKRSNVSYRNSVNAAVLHVGELESALKACFNDLKEIFKIDPPEVMSFSVIGEAVVEFNKEKQIGTEVILPMDYRGEDNYNKFINIIGSDRLTNLTGIPIHPQVSLAKILFLKQQSKQDEYLYLDLGAYFLWRFTGKIFSENTLASRTQYYNLDAKNWDKIILEAIPLQTSELPKIIKTGTNLGKVNKSSASTYGLPFDCEVVAGGFDQCCSSFGAGAFEGGIVTDNIGTTLSIANVFSILPKANRKNLISKGFFCSRYVDNELFFINGGSQSGGIVLEWFANILDLPTDDIGELLKLTKNRITNIDSFPFFTGSGTPSLNSRIRASIHNLDFSCNSLDIFISALDSINFEARLIFDEIQEEQKKSQSIILSGSYLKSPYWVERKAALYHDIEIRFPKTAETSAFGAAIIAAYGIGMFSSLQKASQAWSKTEELKVDPDPTLVQHLLEKYEKYKTTRYEITS